MSRKAGHSSASKILPDGVSQAIHNARKDHETRAANGYPQLATLHDVERELGWPTLNRSRESQRASDWAGLRNTVENRVTAHRTRLQDDVEATNKRKREEDPDFEPPVLRGPQPTTQWFNKSAQTTCGKCGGTFTENGMKTPMSMAHPGWTPERQFKCPQVACNKNLKNNPAAETHNKTVHGLKPKCPECSKEFTARNLNRHRRDMHGVAEEDL